MQRAGLALLIGIAVIAGFTARGMFAPSGLPVATVSGRADATTADAFYAALNLALAGGALDPLEQMLARIYQDHDPSTGDTRTAREFLEDLGAKGRSPQGVRLEPISVTASGDSLIVGIQTVRDDSLLAAGMTVRTELPPPHLETLRVIDGKIVDRWAPAIPWLDVDDASEAAISASVLTQVSATLTRIVVAGGVTYEWDTTSTGVLTIE